MIRSRENPVLRDFRRVREQSANPPGVAVSALAWMVTFTEYRVFHVYPDADLDDAHKVLKRLERVYR